MSISLSLRSNHLTLTAIDASLSQLLDKKRGSLEEPPLLSFHPSPQSGRMGGVKNFPDQRSQTKNKVQKALNIWAIQ
jgi:hypothetical protein